MCLAALSLTGCGPKAATAQSDDSGSGTLKVVATTTQVADFVRTIGTGHVDVVQLVTPNASAHEYKPTPADLQAIGRSKLLFENGVGLEEEWLDKAVRPSGALPGTPGSTSASIPTGRRRTPTRWPWPNSTSRRSSGSGPCCRCRTARRGSGCSGTSHTSEGGEGEGGGRAPDRGRSGSGLLEGHLRIGR
ncbi:zinc ABC transporter solute-binding protein [Streptomyces sp. GS7]|nr:zinc ABC transporter solute-binding protein [Streptomyces sp. GS7]